MNLLLPLLLLLLFLEDIKSQDEIKSVTLVWNLTSERSFLESGSPSLTQSLAKLTRPKDPDVLNPDFSVLARGLHDEDNVYVFLDDINNTSLRLYGELHPKHPNYAFNQTGLSIEKCPKNENSCEELTCDTGKIEVKEPFDDKVAFVSWRKKHLMIELLLQHTNNLVICNDTNDVLNFKKLVIQGNKIQNMSGAGHDFTYTENINETISSHKFDLPANNWLHLGILQCFGCKMSVQLKCDGSFSKTKSVSGDPSRKINFTNKERSVPEWSEVPILGPKKNSSCFLILVTGDQIEGGGSFWAITKRASCHQQDEVPASSSNFSGTTVFVLFFSYFFSSHFNDVLKTYI